MSFLAENYDFNVGNLKKARDLFRSIAEECPQNFNFKEWLQGDGKGGLRYYSDIVAHAKLFGELPQQGFCGCVAGLIWLAFAKTEEDFETPPVLFAAQFLFIGVSNPYLDIFTDPCFYGCSLVRDVSIEDVVRVFDELVNASFRVSS